MASTRFPTRVRTGLCLALCAALAGLNPVYAATAAPTLPAGLKTAVDQTLRSMRPAGAGKHTALNPENRLSLDFDGETLAVAPAGTEGNWQTRLQLTGYGTPGHTQPVGKAQAVAAGARIEYRRGPVTEWYENKPEGLEQGFTLAQPPVPGAKQIELRLGVGGDLTPRLDADGQGARFLDKAGHAAFAYRNLSVVDAKGKRLPAHLALAGKELGIQVEAKDSTWPIVVDPLMLDDESLIEPAAGSEYSFGDQAAIFGDTAAATYNGVIYVFSKSASAGVWQEEVQISPPERIGEGGIILSEDTLVVGAPKWEYGGVDVDRGYPTGPGKAYVYARENSSRGWVLKATLLPKENEVTGTIGNSVAMSGDTLVVSELTSASWPARAKKKFLAAHVFVKPASGWAGEMKANAKLTMSGDGSETMDMGLWERSSRVAVSEDTILIGNKNGAYVFNKPLTGWADASESTQLVTGLDFSSEFVSSVGVSGDTAIVSGDDGIHVFERGAKGWKGAIKVARLLSSDGKMGSKFVLYQDTLLVSGGGAAYLFGRPSDGWRDATESAKIVFSDKMGGSLVGTLAMSADEVLVGTGSSYDCFDKALHVFKYKKTGDNLYFETYANPSTLDTCSVKVSARKPAHGIIKSVPAGIECGNTCDSEFDGTVVFTAKPSKGYKFKRWITPDCKNKKKSCSLHITKSSPYTITLAAEFEKIR